MFTVRVEDGKCSLGQHPRCVPWMASACRGLEIAPPPIAQTDVGDELCEIFYRTGMS